MTTIADKIVKTGNAHRCWGCARMFPAGTTMRRLTEGDRNDGIITTHWCAACREHGKTFDWPDEGIAEGGFLDYDASEWEQTRQRVEEVQ
jgi:hypothetical protein